MLKQFQPPPRRTKLRKGGLATLGTASLAMSLMLVPGAAFAAPYAPEAAVKALSSGTTIPGFQDEFVAQVDQDRVYGHVKKLSVDIGPRVSGSPAEDEAQDYVADLLKGYGFETSREVFNARSQNLANLTPSRDLPGIVSWQYRSATGSLLTGAGAPVSAPVVDIGAGAPFEEAKVMGAFVLTNWESNATKRNDLITSLVNAGAAGIIFTQTTPNGSIPSVGTVPAIAAGIPVVSSGEVQGTRVRDILKSEGKPLTISMTTEQTRADSSNVIGVRPAKNDDGTAPIVYIGAHVDSVVGSPGASDNASGVGIMLETARIMGKYSLDTEIRVGSWGAEEGGILGSKHHAESLTPDEISRTIGAWNMDMAGTSELGTEAQPFGFWGLSVNKDNSTNKVLNFASDVHSGIKKKPLDIGYVGRSDHQSFHDVGIDAAVFSWMFWSADSSIVLEPAYHKPSDTIENVSAERMAFSAGIIGGSAFRAAMNPVTVSVSDEHGEKAVGAKIAMSCTGDSGWREVPATGDTGSSDTLVPNTTCDFAAVGANGSLGSSLGQAVSGATEVEIDLILDEKAPLVTISTDREAGANGWFTTAPVNLTATATDDLDKTPSLELSLGNDNWAAYTGPVALAAEGEHAVQARSVDGAGNIGRAETMVRIDSMAPQVKASATGNVRGQLSVQASDETSGVESIEYRIGASGEWLPFTGEGKRSNGPIENRVEIGNEAVQVDVRATDIAGNVSVSAPVAFAAVPDDSSEEPVDPSPSETPQEPVDPTPSESPEAPADPSPSDGPETQEEPVSDHELAETGADLSKLIVVMFFLLIAGTSVMFVYRRKTAASAADTE